MVFCRAVWENTPISKKDVKSTACVKSPQPPFRKGGLKIRWGSEKSPFVKGDLGGFSMKSYTYSRAGLRTRHKQVRNNKASLAGTVTGPT